MKSISLDRCTARRFRPDAAIRARHIAILTRGPRLGSQSRSRRGRSTAIPVGLHLLAAAACRAAWVADLVFVNGAVYTVTAARSRSSHALARVPRLTVLGGRVVASRMQ